jgi:putative endonuclease
MYKTYILYSAKISKYYTGQTENIDRRLEEHNRGKTLGMAKGMPWDILFLKEFSTRQEALKLEKFIKKRGAARYLKDISADQDG